MRRDLMFFLLGIATLASVGAVGMQELARTFVINLKDPHPITGEVTVGTPIPHSTMASLPDLVVAPAPRTDTSLWTEAGVLDTDGFSAIALSFEGQFRGTPGSQGTLGVVLVPEEENLLRAFAEGEVHLALEASASDVPDGRAYFSGSRAGIPIAFPRYRVFLYNTTDRSASVNLFAYLTH